MIRPPTRCRSCATVASFWADRRIDESCGLERRRGRRAQVAAARRPQSGAATLERREDFLHEVDLGLLVIDDFLR
jgi:hypothetical protein